MTIRAQACPRVGCAIREPHECVPLPFDDDRDVTPAEREIEESTYLHGN